MKKFHGKYYNVAAGMNASNIVPGRRGQRGLNVPPLPTNELNTPTEGVQHDIIKRVADQSFGSG